MSLEDGVIAAFPFNTADPLADYYALVPDLTGSGSPANIAGKIAEAEAVGGHGGAGAGSFLLGSDDAYTLRKLALDDVLGHDFSFTGWVYSTSWAGQPGILSNWANSGGPVQWLLWAKSGTEITFQIRSVLGVDTEATVTAPSTSAWHFYAVRYNHLTGGFSLSVDDGTPATAITLTVAFGDGEIEFGARNSGNAILPGAFDDFVFYDRVLSDAEVTALYNAGAGLEPPFSTPPVAAFSGTPTSGTAPLSVAFTDESTNTPTSWLWDFGDGETSTQQNPTHVFAGIGTFTVSLTATNDDGSDTETKVAYVTTSGTSVSYGVRRSRKREV